MTKVVYNACFGGFGLSRKAIQRYWEIKGQQIWIEDSKRYAALGIFTVWLVPPEEREEKIARSGQTWNIDGLDRHDPALVQVVEELGDKASDKYAKLRIAEVSGPYRIYEYDGLESVETPDSYDWIAP